MDFTIECPCGEQLRVGTADAGGTKRCRCGEANAVPSLSELRRQAGQQSYDVNIADKLRYMFADGTLPPDNVCAKCGCERTPPAAFAAFDFRRSANAIPPSPMPNRFKKFRRLNSNTGSLSVTRGVFIASSHFRQNSSEHLPALRRQRASVLRVTCRAAHLLSSGSVRPWQRLSRNPR